MKSDHDATEDLIAFWRRCPLNGEQPRRYCHPDDEDYFRKKPRLVDGGGLDFHDYVNSDRFGNFKESVFHLSLIPIPYIVLLRQADIVILTLNPSVDYAAYWLQTYSSEYRR